MRPEVSATPTKVKLSDALKTVDRLTNYLKVYEKDIEKTRSTYEDQQKCYFQPKIGRPSLILTPEKSKFSYSFLKKHWQKFRKEPLENKIINSKSERILMERKAKRYHELFNMLNPVNNKICIENVDFEAIPNQVINIIAPLLKELSEIPDGLSYREFSRAMENLSKILSVEEKSLLLNSHRKPHYDEVSFSFKPSINSSSFYVEGSVLERSTKLIANKSQKIKMAQLKSTAKELEQCTFSPVTTKYPGKKLYLDSLIRCSTLA